MKPFNNYDEYLRFLFAFFAAGALFLTGSLVFLFLWDAATGTAHTVEPVKTPVAETRVEALPERPGVKLVEAVPAPSPLEIDSEEQEQLAVVIYREAGGDAACDECRRRVADVVLNRVADERFPDTLAEVLTQKGQYGTLYWDGIVWPDRAENPDEAHAVERARRIAGEVLAQNHSDLHGQGYIFQSEFPDLGSEAVECCGIYYAKG